MLIKLRYPLNSPTDKLILIVSFHRRQETVKKSPDPLKNLSAFNIGESSTCQRNAILNGVSLAGR